MREAGLGLRHVCKRRTSAIEDPAIIRHRHLQAVVLTTAQDEDLRLICRGTISGSQHGNEHLANSFLCFGGQPSQSILVNVYDALHRRRGWSRENEEAEQ